MTCCRDIAENRDQSVNDTKAHPQLTQVDYKLKILKSVRNLMHRPELFQTNQFLKSMRNFIARDRALSNKPNIIEIG